MCECETRHAHLHVYVSESKGILNGCIHIRETECHCACLCVSVMMTRYRDKSAVMLCRACPVCQTQGSRHKPKVTACWCTAQAPSVTHALHQPTVVFIFLFLGLALDDTHIMRHTHSPHLSLSLSLSQIQRHTFSNFSDLSYPADVTVVIVSRCLSGIGWWQGGDTASHGSRLCFAQFKHSDKTTWLSVILRLSTLTQTGCNSPSPLTTKQTGSVYINASPRITEMVCNFPLGNTTGWRTISPTSTQLHTCTSVWVTVVILKWQ